MGLTRFVCTKDSMGADKGLLCIANNEHRESATMERGKMASSRKLNTFSISHQQSAIHLTSLSQSSANHTSYGARRPSCVLFNFG